MRKTLRVSIIALSGLVGSVLLAANANAMPTSGLAAPTHQVATGIQDVRWVCGPFRCWWRPGPYWYRPYWGFHPGWHRWAWHRRAWW